MTDLHSQYDLQDYGSYIVSKCPHWYPKNQVHDYSMIYASLVAFTLNFAGS